MMIAMEKCQVTYKANPEHTTVSYTNPGREYGNNLMKLLLFAQPQGGAGPCGQGVVGAGSFLSR